MDRNLHSSTDPISAGDAFARFAGVVLLVLVGYAHLLDLSHKIDEGIWYMAFGFLALIALSICVATALVRSPAQAVRVAWIAAALICLGALFGYAVSGLIPLPGMADHQGDWINTYGVLALLAEAGLVALAAYAMRDLTVRGVPHEPSQWLRPPSSAAWPAAALALTTLATLPTRAVAHGGEEDEGPASGSPTRAETSTGKGSDGTGSESTMHGDPFLGTVELGLAFLACVGFVYWAARSLHARVELGAVPA